MAKYRQSPDTDIWHWCRNCTRWPTADYVEQDERPAHDLCNECKAKEALGMCRSDDDA